MWHWKSPPSMILLASSTVLWILLAVLPQNTNAWVVTPSIGVSQRPTSATTSRSTRRIGTISQLNANPFDWLLHPNKKESEDETKHTGNSPNDFFANWFQTMSPPKDASLPPPPMTTPEIPKVDGTATVIGTDMSNENKKMMMITQSELTSQSHSSSSVVLSEPSDMIPTTMIHKGSVLWFDPQRGFGFILLLTPDDEEAKMKKTTTTTNDDDDGDDKSTKNGESIFVHNTNIDLSEGYFRTLIRGEAVEFQLERDTKGRRIAIHVTGPHGTPVKSILQQQLDDGPSPHRRKEKK